MTGLLHHSYLVRIPFLYLVAATFLMMPLQAFVNWCPSSDTATQVKSLDLRIQQSQIPGTSRYYMYCQSVNLPDDKDYDIVAVSFY